MDALLAALALREPELLDAVRAVLVDTEFSHAGKPEQSETVHQQIRKRLNGASDFARRHGADSAA